MSPVEVLRSRLIDAARDIRNCLDCTEGWVHGDDGNYRCRCWKVWDGLRGELAYEFGKLKKAAREQYPDLITAEMLNWRTPSISDEEIVTPERQVEIMQNAARLGNKFAQWKTGMEKEERW